MATTGVSTTEINQLVADFGRTISYKVSTKTTDSITGDETTSFAAAANITAIFYLNDTRYIFDKDGLLEVGDAYIIAPTSVGIKRYDQFTIDGITYFIETVTRRLIGTVTYGDYGVCFKVA